MGRLRHKQTVPHGGRYELNLPEKGMVGLSYNFDGLLDAIKRFRHANAIPVGLGFEDEVEREICLKYPQECIESDPSIPTKRALNIGDVVRGTEMSVRHLMAGRVLESDEEANRRALICSQCQYNEDFPTPCGSLCGTLHDIVKKTIGSKTTQYHDKLKSCRICHCFVEVAAFVPLDIQWQVLDDQQKLQFRTAATDVGCWKVLDETAQRD